MGVSYYDFVGFSPLFGRLETRQIVDFFLSVLIELVVIEL
jgi:hypothetical protein